MVSRGVLIKTAFNGLSMVFLGTQLSQRGPAFIDLINISGTGVEGGSVYITGGNIAYMLGSFISGYLYSRVKMASLTLALALMFSGLLTGVTPWCTSFTSMLLVMAIFNVFIGLLDTTISTEQMRICQGDSGWALQFLSLAYSVGGIIGPLITEPFLAPKDTANTTEYDSSLNYTNISSGLNLDMSPNMPGMVSSDNLTLSLTRRPATGRDMANKSDSGNTKYSIRYAFLITAVLGVMMSIPFFVQSFRSCNKKRTKEESAKSTPSSRKLPKKAYLTVVAIASIYYFLFTAFEDAFVHYLSYFVVKHLDWSKEDGALVTAVYWIFSTCFKLALVFLSSRIDNGTILLVCNIGMVFSCLGFTVVSQIRVHSMVWVFTAVLGSFLSALYGGAMAWVDSDLLQMDGRATASLVISSGLGATVMPIPIGTLMKNWTTMTFPYLMFGVSCLATTTMIVLLFIIKPRIQEKYGPPRPGIVTEGQVSSQEESADWANWVLLDRLPSNGNNNNGERVTKEAA